MYIQKINNNTLRGCLANDDSPGFVYSKSSLSKNKWLPEIKINDFLSCGRLLDNRDIDFCEIISLFCNILMQTLSFYIQDHYVRISDSVEGKENEKKQAN